MIKIIAAVGKNNELGKNNDLIWHLPGDLKFFKEQTIGHTVAMGRNTFNSLPKKLVNRKHMVLSNVEDFNKETSDVTVIYNAYEFVRQCLLESEGNDLFIIGGASIYDMFIDFADEIYLTEIEAEGDADVYFPQFEKADFDKEILGCGQDNGVKYKHVRYFNRKKYKFQVGQVHD